MAAAVGVHSVLRVVKGKGQPSKQHNTVIILEMDRAPCATTLLVADDVNNRRTANIVTSGEVAGDRRTDGQVGLLVLVLSACVVFVAQFYKV